MSVLELLGHPDSPFFVTGFSKNVAIAEPFIAKAVAKIDYPKQIVGKLWWHDALNTYHNFSLRAVMNLSNQGRKHLRR